MPQSDTLLLRSSRHGHRRRKPRRPWRIGGPLLALIAVGVVLVSAWFMANPGRRQTAAISTRRPVAIIPADRQHVRFDTTITGRCATIDHAVTNEMRGWGGYTFDPGRIPVTDAHGRTLLPSNLAASKNPPGLDAVVSGSARPDDETQWQVAAGSRQMPASPAGSCRTSVATAWPDAVRSGRAAIRLQRPGPYVYWTLEHTVHWVKVNDVAPNPAPRPCSDGATPHATSPAPAGDPPSADGETWHWTVDSFCTKVRWWMFAVLGSRGRCPRATDGSLWPRQTYINQYAAGARLHLPLGRGEAGGNACGPSALMMAMLLARHRHERHATAAVALGTVFDKTMQHRRARVRPNAENDFVGTKAADFLAHRGWTNATFGRLGTSAESIGPETTGSDQDPSNEATIDRALKRGPMLISTDFGTARWGATGDGHMIVVLGRARGNPGEYVVYDPAGNYFASPTHHYDISSCGAAVLYPQSWLYAYTTGAWFIALGTPKA